MKLLKGWVMSAGLMLCATAANAQVLAPYETGRPSYSAVSDVAGPYVGLPPEAPVARYGPMLLPPTEVYTIVRESGFSPLGIPHQRGLVYVIAVIDRGGDDGRLVIDARTGRIIRFVSAWRTGNNFYEGYDPYGPPGSPPPSAAGTVRGEPRSQLSAPPRVASRTPPVPLPKPTLPHAGEIKPQAAKPAPAMPPAQQSAAVKPADAPPSAAAPAAVEPKPAPQIQPTQDMPKVQGLD
jgi:hypothetical protein